MTPLQILKNQILEQQPQVMITYQFQRYADNEMCQRMLSQFDARMCRALFDRGWYKPKYNDKRPISYMFREKGFISGKTNYHTLVVFPYQPEVLIPRFKAIMTDIWRGICPGGTIDAQDLDSLTSTKTRINYATKDWYRDDNADCWIFNQTFRHRTKSRLQEDKALKEKIAEAFRKIDYLESIGK